MGEMQTGVDAIVTLIPSQSPPVEALPTTEKQDLSLALQDVRSCLFELAKKSDPPGHPVPQLNFLKE